MANKNACFKLVFKGDMTYIRIFEGENTLKADEVTKYLINLNIKTFNMAEISEAVNCGQTCDVLVASKRCPVEKESLTCSIASDRMSATVRFYMPSDDGKLMTREEITDMLAKRGIIFGIDTKVLSAFERDRQYCTDYVIAHGKPVVEGKESVITYNFKKTFCLTPKMNEDGSVDFHSLDNINRINKGDVIATMTPMIQGQDGKDVMGNVIKARKVMARRFRHGEKIYVSEDGLSLISDVDGHVRLDKDKVVVSDTFEVRGDVDNNTGDIDFPGEVHIHGSIMSGFKVKAKGSITVDGVVECAQVISGGNIIVKKGVQGRKRGVLMAKGDIVAKFIENAIIRADGVIRTESIIYSDVSSNASVIVNGKLGNIVGGIVRAKEKVECKTAGSTMETKTEFEVGVDPALSAKLVTLKSEITALQSGMTADADVIKVLKKRLEEGKEMNKENLELLKTTMERYSNNTKEIAKKNEEIKSIEEEIQSFTNGSVIVHLDACIGVKITISNAICYVRSKKVRTKFVKDHGEIREMPL